MEDLDSNRPHGLEDLLDRIPSAGLSWADVDRVRQYIGADRWAKVRQFSNDRDLAHGILFHLEDVASARKTVAPYLEIGCARHDAPVGQACSHYDGHFAGVVFDESRTEPLALPKIPIICFRRVLAKHDRTAAAELFVEEPKQGVATFGSRQVLPIGGDLHGDRVIARAQYRHPRPLVAKRLFIGNVRGWCVHDIRIADKSILAPHHDLPAYVFGNSVMGAPLRMPVVEQDQWIEIEVVRENSDSGNEAQWFRCGLVGATAA